MPEFDAETRRDSSAALEHVRRIVATCHADCRRMLGAVAAKPIRSVGIIGAGIMGTAIAVEHAARSIPVVLTDSNPDALRSAAQVAARELAAAERYAPQFRAPASIVYTPDPRDLAGCDLVLESIAEKRPAKQALYAQIQPHLAERTILTTNTSTIPISRLASGLANPDRFCGLHFCHPVRFRPLVEVIGGNASSLETLATATAHALALGKLPLTVSDSPGFIVNRLLLTYLNAAMGMVTSGVPIERIDRDLVGFDMPLGPLELLDEIGLDTALQSGVVMSEVIQERSPASELLVKLVKAGQLGIKSGAGFYRYPEKTPNPSVGGSSRASLNLGVMNERELPSPAIANALLAPMVYEACRMLREKVVAAAWQVDLATIFGLGFPLRRGGLLWWGVRAGLADMPSLLGENLIVSSEK